MLLLSAHVQTHGRANIASLLRRRRHTLTLRRCCGEVLPQSDDSVGKCFHNEGIIVQWQSELHGEPSILAVGVEQHSGHRPELSQQELKYIVFILVVSMSCTVHTVPPTNFTVRT